jgi:hypothetical protein
MVRLFSIAALLLVASITCDAFCLPKQSLKVSSFVRVPPKSVKKSVGWLYAAAAAAAADEPTEWDTKGEPFVAEEEEQQQVEEEEEETVVLPTPKEEDPEMVALKQEIVNLESALKAKQRELSYQEEQVDHYSKTGYARKVAEMETMRRSRSVRTQHNNTIRLFLTLSSWKKRPVAVYCVCVCPFFGRHWNARMLLMWFRS